MSTYDSNLGLQADIKRQFGAILFLKANKSFACFLLLFCLLCLSITPSTESIFIGLELLDIVPSFPGRTFLSVEEGRLETSCLVSSCS